MWDAASALRRLEELSAEVDVLRAQEKDQAFSLVSAGAPSGADTTRSTEHVQTALASLRMAVEQLRRLDSSDHRVRRRVSTLASGRHTAASGPFPSEVLRELCVLRADIEELLAERELPVQEHLEPALPVQIGDEETSQVISTQEPTVSITLCSANLHRA